MIKQIWLKEIKSELYTWKSLVWLFVSSLLFSFTSYLLLTNKELSLLDQTELLWILGKVIIGVAVLMVAIDASSIINLEFEKETAESLFLSPLSLKDFIIGKFLASLTLWLAVFAVASPYIIVASIGTNLVLPFLIYTALLGTLGIAGFVMIIFGISFLYRSSKNTITTSLIVLLAFSVPAIFSSTLKNNPAAMWFGKINPIDNIFSSLDNILVDYQTSIAQNLNFIVPLLVFCAVGLAVLLISAKHSKIFFAILIPVILLSLPGFFGQADSGLSLSIDILSADTLDGTAGDFVTVQSKITNIGSQPISDVTTYLSLVDNQNKLPVDLEDWSAEKGLFIGTIEPGQTMPLNWKIHFVKAGTYSLAVVAISPMSGTPEVSKLTYFQVNPKHNLNPGKILPVALGMPIAVLLALAAASFRRRQN
jgi:ABC-type transport system involved in multi-copper enzyme maturation permease subunit